MSFWQADTKGNAVKKQMETPDLIVSNVENIGTLFLNYITVMKDENGKQKIVVTFDTIRRDE